jgi:hypothetical protein
MKKSDRRMDIDLVAQICGHFTDCETNNGYGCDHPESNQNDPEHKGECHRIGCPVAIYDSDKDMMEVQELELIEMIKHGVLNYDKTEYREWIEKRSSISEKTTTGSK